VLAGKKGQAMVVDLILLVIISSFFFLFLSQQVGNQSINAGAIRSQSNFNDKLMLSLLNYRVKDSFYQNATVLELADAYHCGHDELLYKPKDFLNNTINQFMNNMSKKNYLFIFISESPQNTVYSCSPEVSNKYGKCCVKTEKISVSVMETDLPCGGISKKELGIWPASMEVEACE
jgi:hypothetical protein